MHKQIIGPFIFVKTGLIIKLIETRIDKYFIINTYSLSLN